MAVLYVTECSQLGYTTNGQQLIMAPFMPPVAEQTVGVSGTATSSNTFSALTHFVMVNCDSTCSLAWSSTSTTVSAVTTAQRMSQYETRFYSVNPGGSVSVVSNT